LQVAGTVSESSSRPSDEESSQNGTKAWFSHFKLIELRALHHGSSILRSQGKWLYSPAAISMLLWVKMVGGQN